MINLEHEKEYTYDQLMAERNMCICGEQLPPWEEDTDSCKITTCDKCGRIYSAAAIIFNVIVEEEQ